MNKYIEFILLFFIFTISYFTYNVVRADTIRVGIIDTGYDFKSTWTGMNVTKPILCKEGHKNFVRIPRPENLQNQTVDEKEIELKELFDNHGHGTNVAGLIAKYAEGVDYCLVITKFYDPTHPNMDNLLNSQKAFQYLIDQGVDIINYSGGGLEKSFKECSLVTQALDKGIVVVAAAGNERGDLDKDDKYYPALCDNRVIVVTNLIEGENRLHLATSSNYSKTNKVSTFNERGCNELTIKPKNEIGTMCGTSQATAVTTGKIVKLLSIAFKKDRKHDNRTTK